MVGKNIIMIRHQLETIVGEELRILAIKTRARRCFTQREMGERLEMSESSYSDIETGKCNCGTLTAVLLLGMQEDPKGTLALIGAKISAWYAKEMMTV